MIRRCGVCLVAISSLAFASPAHADDNVDPYALTPEQLFHATVISASRTQEEAWEAPTAIYVITAADIARAGVTSIPEALRLAPGVEVARINSSGWAISIRGFNSALANKLLVLIDGREIYDPLFSGVYWDVQDTPLEDIERIEVVRGPGASLWGANAVNGVINIITKRAVDTQGTLLSATVGNERRITARQGGALGSNAHWRIFGQAFDMDGQEALAGGDDNSDWSEWRGGFRVDAQLSERDALTVQGDLYHSETGQLRSTPLLTAPYFNIAEEDINAEGGNVLARWTRDEANGGHFAAQAYLDLTRRDQLTLRDRRTTIDIDAQYNFPNWGAHSLIIGARYRNTADRVVETAIITSDSTHHDEQLFSVFFQDQIALSDAWRLTLGSKVDDNDYTGIEVQPTVRLQWMQDSQMAWAAVSRAVRSPSELEREFNVVAGVIPPNIFLPVPTSVELVPNDAFESEELVAYELGYRRQVTPDLALDVALFHNEYNGLATLSLLPPGIGFNPLHLILPIQSTNNTDGETDGIELAIDWEARQDFHVLFNYAYLDMDLSGPPPNVAIASEAAERQFAHNRASLRLQWDATERFAADTTVYYADEIPSFAVASHIRTDLRMGYRVTDHVQFEMIGRDIFDDEHREFGAPTDANAASIGRSVVGRLSWRS